MGKEIDIWSRGEVASYLLKLEKNGQIKACLHMGLEFGHADAYYPRCGKEWASRIDAKNVPLDITAYRGPSSYWWPECPNDCPHYESSDNFLLTVSKDQFDNGFPSRAEDSEESKPLSINGKRNNDPLPYPEKVTLKWLITHVDWKLWVTAICIIGAAFSLGVQASRISLVKEIFGLPEGQKFSNNSMPDDTNAISLANIDLNKASQELSNFRSVLQKIRDDMNSSGYRIIQEDLHKLRGNYEKMVKPYVSPLQMNKPGEKKWHGYTLRYDNPVDLAITDFTFFNVNLSLDYLSRMIGRIEYLKKNPANQ